MCFSQIYVLNFDYSIEFSIFRKVSRKSEKITARFAKIKSQGAQRRKLQEINFASIAKPWRTLR